MAALAKVLMNMGIVPSDTDQERLVQDMELLAGKYVSLPLQKMRVGEAINDILQVAYDHGLKIPPQFTMAARCLMTLEGSIQLLDPEVSVLEIARPMGHEILRERLSPGNLARRFSETAAELSQEIREIPSLTGSILRKLDEGELQVRMAHAGIPETLSKLERIANKIVFSIALLGFSIIIAALIIGYALGNLPSVGHFGRLQLLELALIVALFMLGFLMISIFRSGRF